MDNTTLVRLLKKDMPNAETIGGEYPRMMYRKTDEPETQVLRYGDDGKPKEWATINEFGGFLCEMLVVDTADEAEALSEAGWDTSPAAAHGVTSGMAAKTTAKDDEIASLRAQLAAAQAVSDDPDAVPVDQPRRGRPPRNPAGDNI